MADKKRIIEGYEVINAIELGGGEIILAENKKDAEAPYMVCDCNWNKDFGMKLYQNAMGSTDFVEIMKLFAARLAERVVSIETERDTRGIPFQTLTATDCHPVGKTDLEGCVVVIKPDKLAPEYQTIDYQLALCTGGFGASPDSNGRTVFCQNLITGETTKYNRSDIMGTVSEERLPDWARVNLDALRQADVKKPAIVAAEPLGKDQFWQMIDSARDKAEGWQGMLDPLVEAISKLEEPDIIRFKQIFDEYHKIAYKDKLWAAATLTNSGCSDDGFAYFRAWLIAQGKEVYLNALAEPDSLADIETVKALSREVQSSEYMPSDGYHNQTWFEDIWYAASYAYEKKFGSDADLYALLDNNPLTDQEKADIAADITFAVDIDSRSWRGRDSWDKFMGTMREFLPNLHSLFSGEEAHNHEFKLYFPVNITLFHGKPGEEAVEPYFTAGVTSQYVEAVNKAFREHPITNAAENGLIKYFYTDDEAYDSYVRSNISCAIPSIADVNGELYGVITYTVNSDLELPYKIVDALKEDIENQVLNGWDGEALEIDVPISGGVLRYDNGRSFLESQQGVSPDGEALQNAVLNVRVSPNDFDYAYTLEELQHRIESIAVKYGTPDKTSEQKKPGGKESVLEKIRQDRQGKQSAEPKPKNKKNKKDGPEL